MGPANRCVITAVAENTLFSHLSNHFSVHGKMINHTVLVVATPDGSVALNGHSMGSGKIQIRSDCFYEISLSVQNANGIFLRTCSCNHIAFAGAGNPAYRVIFHIIRPFCPVPYKLVFKRTGTENHLTGAIEIFRKVTAASMVFVFPVICVCFSHTSTP